MFLYQLSTVQDLLLSCNKPSCSGSSSALMVLMLFCITFRITFLGWPKAVELFAVVVFLLLFFFSVSFLKVIPDYGSVYTLGLLQVPLKQSSKGIVVLPQPWLPSLDTSYQFKAVVFNNNNGVNFYSAVSQPKPGKSTTENFCGSVKLMGITGRFNAGWRSYTKMSIRQMYSHWTVTK